MSGMLLDSRPSNPNRALQMETQHVPSVQATDAKGELYARVAPTRFPCGINDESPVVHRITSYNKTALWDNVQAWFQGGAEAEGAIRQRELLFMSFRGAAERLGKSIPTMSPKNNGRLWLGTPSPPRLQLISIRSAIDGTANG